MAMFINNVNKINRFAFQTGVFPLLVKGFNRAILRWKHLLCLDLNFPSQLSM